MNHPLQKDIADYLAEFHKTNSSNALQPLAVFDRGVPGSFLSLADANLERHTNLISGVLRHLLKSEHSSFLERSYSVSKVDCFKKGYDQTRFARDQVAPGIKIEAHAYSVPENEKLNVYDRQLGKLQASRATNSLIVTSCGHDLGRNRFPGTVESTLALGMLDPQGQMVGQTPLRSARPDLFVEHGTFQSRLVDGTETTVAGSSPSVVIVAFLASLLSQRVNQTFRFFSEILKSLLLLLTEEFQGKRLLRRARHIQNAKLHGEYVYPSSNSARINFNVRFTPGFSGAARISVVPVSPASNIFWRQPPFQFGDGTSEFCHVQEFTAEKDVEISWRGLHCGFVISSFGCELENFVFENELVKKSGDRIVVGVSASHDASACVVKNGELLHAVQLERLTRVKHDGESSLSNDAAIDFCLKSAGLTAEDVDLFAFNIQALTPEYVGLSQPVQGPRFNSFDPFAEKSLFVSHHLSHAFSAFAGSRFNNAKVVVCDGSGGTTVGADDLMLTGPELRKYLDQGLRGLRPLLHTFSVYEFDHDSFRLIDREASPSFNVRAGSSSLGEAYAALSQFVFGSWQSSGKLMGLAPYGEAHAEIMRDLFEDPENPDKGFGFRWKLPIRLKSKNPMEFKDLAASMQRVLELALIARFRKNISARDSVAYAGGVALNSVANRKLREDLKLLKFFQLPAASDCGISIGAAASGDFHLTGKISSSLFAHDYLGHVYGHEDLSYALNRYSQFVTVRPATNCEVAKMISDGLTVASFSLEKGSEFGPRALGARSILADPRKKSTWEHINRWIKYREEFRPFAPMVAREKLDQFFEADEDLPYMLEVVKVRNEHAENLGAVTHVDRSARVQTVSAYQNAPLHDLLLEFEKLSGYPILLNTSFNVRGQPIVETPVQAVEMLLSTQLDAVLSGGYVIETIDRRLPLTNEQVLQLAPGCELTCRIVCGGQSTSIVAGHQAKTYKLSRALYELLFASQGKPFSLGEQSHLSAAALDEVRSEVQRLILLRVFCRGARVP